MGRELRRKEERKNKKILETKQVELDTSIKGLTVVKLIGAIVLILLVLYYILAVFVTKEIDVSNKNNSTSNNSESTSNVSNKILASAIFNQKEEDYYVYFYDFTDEDESVANAISNRSDLKIYRVDTSSSLNSKYVTEDANSINVDSIETLKVKNPTLIHVEADKVTAYHQGSTSILGFLG